LAHDAKLDFRMTITLVGQTRLQSIYRFTHFLRCYKEMKFLSTPYVQLPLLLNTKLPYLVRKKLQQKFDANHTTHEQ